MKLKIKTLAGMGKLFSRLTLKSFIGNGDGANRRSRRTCGPAIWLGLMFVGANAALLGVPSAHAATTLYDVQFNSSSLYQQTGAAVIGQTGDYWNRLAAASGASTLINAAGAASGGSLTWSASGILVGGTANPSFGNGDADLMDGYIYCSSGSQNITFSNLTANAPFTLYIYTQGDSATTGRRLSVTFNGSTYTSSAAVAGATAFVSGQNYLTISGTTTASGTLPFSYTYAVGEADINGLQLSVANIAPAIAAQPASQTLAVGGMVNLNVTPAGTAPFFYQWFKNGGVVLGATNSALTYSNAGVTNSGVYYVVITNSVGLCISQPAAVTVGTPQLLAWGENTSGQLGDGTTISRSLPESVATNAVTAAAGETHSLYVKSDGTLWAMGGNAYGQLGDGTLTTRSNAVSVAVNVVSVTAGRYHSLYLKNDGTLWAMGFNGYGQLGDGTQTNRSNAVSVASNVVAVAAGYYHSLYLKNDGTLWATGANNDGQLGDGTLTTREIAELVASNVVTVASGGLHSLYVKGDGTLWTMGWNTNGQLGDGTLINRSNAVSVASNVVAVAAGYFHSLYAKSDGTLWTMGYNGYGELGDGTLINRSNAVSVASNVVTVTGEFSDSMFLKNDGTLWGMGDNELGELGDGTTTQRTSPVSVSGMSLANIISGEDSIWTFGVGVPLPPTIISQPTNRTVTAGGTVTFTVTASGFAPLACQWQFNGTNINGATATNYVLTGVTATNAGNYTVVVSNPGGSVTSSVSVLTINKSTPTVTAWPTATAIIYGQTLTASTLNGGLASVPGSFAFTAPSTAPGVGTASQAVTFTPTDTTDYNAVTNSVSVTVNKATPVVTTWPTATAITYGQTLAASTLNGGLASVPGNFAFTTPSTAPTTTALQGVTFTPTDTADYNAVTNSVSVTVNKVTPVVTTWPTATAITYGQTLAASTLSGGTASVDGSFAFTLPSTAPGAGTAVQSVVFTPTDLTDYNAVGNSVSVTVDKATATVVFHPTPLLATCDGTAKSVTATTVPSGLTVAITYNGAGAAPTNAGIYTVIGIISDANYEGGATNQLSIAMTGPAVAWGMGTSGQLGNGGSTNSPLPVAILNSGVLAGKTIVGVAGGSAHSYALTSEGLVYAWGNNSYGELGNNGTASSPVPVMVYTNGALSGKKITAIASGENHALALSADGLLFTWGWNNNLQLGNGSTVSYTNVPVAVDMTGVLAGKTVVALGTGNMHNQVITSDGQIFTWGYGQFGQLGNGATTNSGVPVAVDMNGVLSGKTVIAASGGWEHTVALTSDGLVYTWGAGENYQLGNGATTNSSVPVAVATDGVLSGKTIVAIAAGEYHCLAVSSEGQVYSWGPNSNGELGNGTSTPSSVPVAVSTDGALSGKTVVSVRGTYDSSVALTDDGQVFSWGYNGNGELGNPAYANYSYVPVPVDESGALAGLVVSAISSSSQAYHVIALTIGLTAPALTSATTVTGIYGEAFTFTVAGNCVGSYSATGLPGWLAFDPATGILSGTPTMTGVFDITLVATNAFGSTSGNLAITVDKATPVVTTWPTATAITYGQTLADSTLSGGSASVDGSFAFTTPSTQPAVGTAQQVVTFTPTDTADYNTVSSMTVAGMSLHCTGSFGPTTTLNGVELGAETAFSMVATFDPTLNLAPFPSGSGVGVYAATASITIDGYGTYQSAAGADFNIWLMNPTEMFVPFYAAGFGDQSGENGVSQIFNSTTPAFFAEAPTPTTFSDNLGPDQGNFPFAIPLGDGTSSLVVNDLGAATFTAEIIGGGTQLTGPEVTVNKITPVVTTWPMATAITYGQTLAASTLSGGSASVDGSFAFTTPSTAPGVGTALQWVTFNPTDTTDYNTVSNSVSVTVTNPLPPIMTVTVAADPTNAGSVTVDGVCYVGSNVVLTATASNNWQFVSWNDGTTNNPYTITVPATNITYTASFLPTRTVTALANPTNAGSAMVAGVCYVGSNVVLTATASNNWQFVSWNDGTTNNPYVITVPDTNITYTAEFAATATITVDASPSNGGLVTGGGTFLVGSTNFITASASNNWVFTRWSDAVTDKTRAIVITTNRTYTADFVSAATVTTVAAQPAGGATTGDGPYAIGSTATVTAAASTNWLFLNWNGTVTNYTTTGNPHNPFSFTVTTNVTQTANFGQVTNGFVFLVLTNYTPPQVEIIGYVGPTNGQVVVPTTIDGLKVTIIGPGAFWNNGVTNIVITSNVTQVASGSITAGVIELLAVGAGIAIAADAFEDAAEIDMVEMAADVMADVMEDLADDDDVDSLKNVTVSASPEDGGICTGSGMYSEDRELLITATANTGWKFTHWSDGSTEAEHNVTVVEDAEFVATFVKQVKVTAEVNEEEAGIVTGSATYSVGDPVTLTATTTNSEWRFKNWTDEEGAAVSIENIYEFEAPEEDVTYTANFVEQVEIEAEAEPTNGGFVIGGGTYDAGSPVILVATTNSGWRFNGWFLDGFITNTPTLITVASSSLEDLKYKAKFVQIVTVTGLANPTNGGTVTGGAVYDVGDTNVILTATAARGWTFVRWNDGATGNQYTNTAPATNITYTANFAAVNPTNITTSLVGNQLTLAWPADHVGWVLQSLTNNLISAGWYDLPGSGNTNWMMIQIDPANTAVFYRLRQP